MTSTKQIIQNTWRLILPISASRLLIMLTSFSGILIIAQISQQVLAASAFISSFQAFLFFCGFSLLFSVSAMVGHAFGGKRYEEIGSIFQQALLFGVLVSIPVIIVMLNIGKILILLNQTPQIASIVQSYFNFYCISVPAIAGTVVCQQLILAVNKRKLVFFMSFINLFVAVTSAWFLVDFLHIGVAGLSIAYSIQIWLALIIYLAYCYIEPSFKHYQLFSWRIRQTFHLLKQLFHIGWPITVQTSSDLLGFVLMNIFVGWLGTESLAAQQIVSQYFMLLCVPILAISQASTILISQARGAQQFDDINRYAYATVGFAIFFSVLVLLLFTLFPHYLIHLYIHHHPEISRHFQKLACTVLILTGFRLMFDSILEVKIGSLRGLYDTRFPMLMTILFLIIGLILAYLLGFTFNYGLIGMTSAGIITTVTNACILWLRWHMKSKSFCR